MDIQIAPDPARLSSFGGGISSEPIALLTASATRLCQFGAKRTRYFAASCYHSVVEALPAHLRAANFGRRQERVCRARRPAAENRRYRDSTERRDRTLLV